VSLQPVTHRIAQAVLERQGFRVTDQLPDTGDVRYTLSLEPAQPM